MATTTTNLGLTKPDATDNVSISTLNTNFDTIDSALMPKAGGTFTGGVSGTTASFSGAVSGASVSATGAVSGASATISGTTTCTGGIVLGSGSYGTSVPSSLATGKLYVVYTA